jgi:hypothetical protein
MYMERIENYSKLLILAVAGILLFLTTTAMIILYK